MKVYFSQKQRNACAATNSCGGEVIFRWSTGYDGKITSKRQARKIRATYATLTDGSIVEYTMMTDDEITQSSWDDLVFLGEGELSHFVEEL